MAATVISFGTALPETVLEQQDARDLFLGQPDLGALPRRLIGAAFDASGIARRRTVLPELAAAATASTVYVEGGRILSPTTGRRNDDYTRFAPGLFAAAARESLAGARMDPSEVTDVVTVSCTGFFAPGPDVRLVRDLGLRPDARRTHIGFMGCHGGLLGLRAAAAAVAADPDAVVLLVAAELCSLHLRPAHGTDEILGASLFSDGAAAALVTGAGRTGAADGPTLELRRFETLVLPDGEDQMAWTIGDAGFEMVLGKGVPAVIGTHIGAAVATLLAGSGTAADEIAHWAVHPGGRAILDRIEQVLGLTPAALAASRTELRENGNTSSVSLLRILARQLAEAAAGRLGDGPLAAFAFGPGLTVESGLFAVQGTR